MTPPRILKRLANWWAGWRPRPLNGLLAVGFDAAGVRVRVLWVSKGQVSKGLPFTLLR
jgi:hypothetical protein